VTILDIRNGRAYKEQYYIYVKIRSYKVLYLLVLSNTVSTEQNGICWTIPYLRYSTAFKQQYCTHVTIGYINNNILSGGEMDILVWTRTMCLTFTIVWLCIVTDSLWIKPTDALNSNFIGITTLNVSGNLSAHHQEFLAVHRLWCILCSCGEPFATRSRMELMEFHPTPSSKRSQLHKMYKSRCTAKNSWWWAERLPETCRV